MLVIKSLRHIFILLFSIFILWFTYASKYGFGFFDSFILLFLISIWLLLFIITLSKEIRKYKEEKHLNNFMYTFIIFMVNIISIALGIKINHDFNKPTLLKAFYDGDYNGAGIDLKGDGRYIYDDSAIGISDYTYGQYIIKNNTVILYNGKTVLQKFIIVKSETEHYLSEIDSLGIEINPFIKFRIVIDNRNKSEK